MQPVTPAVPFDGGSETPTQGGSVLVEGGTLREVKLSGMLGIVAGSLLGSAFLVFIPLRAATCFRIRDSVADAPTVTRP